MIAHPFAIARDFILFSLAPELQIEVKSTLASGPSSN